MITKYCFSPAWMIAVFAFAISAAAAQDDKRPTVQNLLEEHMGYFVRDGGNWLSETPNFQPGDTGPKQIGYEYRWTFHNSAVENTLYGIFENGDRRDFAKAIFVWNAKAGKVEQFIFGATGGIGHGFEDPKGGGIIEDEFTWTNSHGENQEFKDWVKITGPNSLDNATYIRNSDSEWNVQANSERQFVRTVE